MRLKALEDLLKVTSSAMGESNEIRTAYDCNFQLIKTVTETSTLFLIPTLNTGQLKLFNNYACHVQFRH